MDYKEIASLMRWHAIYSELNGAEARVIMFMAASANYKTSRIAISYAELANTVSLSKTSAAKAINSLVEKKAIAIDTAATGRMQSSYRIRSSKELNEYFSKEINNVGVYVWEEEINKRFGKILDKIEEQIEASDSCEDCTEEKRCEMHNYKIKSLEESEEYRDYKMWIADNPKPNHKITLIHGKKTVED